MQGVNFDELPPFVRRAMEQAGISGDGLLGIGVEVGRRNMRGDTISELLGKFAVQVCPACQALDMFGEMIAEHSAKAFADKIKKAGLDYDKMRINRLQDAFESPMGEVKRYWHSRISELHFEQSSSLELMEEFLYPLLEMANSIADSLFLQYVALQDAPEDEDDEEEGEEEEYEEDDDTGDEDEEEVV